MKRAAVASRMAIAVERAGDSPSRPPWYAVDSTTADRTWRGQSSL
jgi:hypothetical protein